MRSWLGTSEEEVRATDEPSADSPFVPAVAPATPPDDRCGAVLVHDAVVTPVRKGDLRTTTVPRRWMTGAVHDAEGNLVPGSQRLWAGDSKSPVPADPAVVRVPQQAEQMAGDWLYLGHWLSHFGHFLLETLTDLWPDPAAFPVRGLVAHHEFRGEVPPVGGAPASEAKVKGWQRDLLARAGYGDLPVLVVRGRPARVERLLVPDRPVVLKSWAKPPAVDVWRRIARTVEPASDRRVFLSRKLFHEAQEGNRRRVRVVRGWDDELEDMFGAAGFRVVHPETLPLAEQIALVRGADVLAGLSGSALHLAVFADPGTRVLEIGDSRSPREPMPSQRMIDAACGHRSAFVEHGAADDLRSLLARL